METSSHPSIALGLPIELPTWEDGGVPLKTLLGELASLETRLSESMIQQFANFAAHQETFLSSLIAVSGSTESITQHVTFQDGSDNRPSHASIRQIGSLKHTFTADLPATDTSAIKAEFQNIRRQDSAPKPSECAKELVRDCLSKHHRRKLRKLSDTKSASSMSLRLDPAQLVLPPEESPCEEDGSHWASMTMGGWWRPSAAMTGATVALKSMADQVTGMAEKNGLLLPSFDNKIASFAQSQLKEDLKQDAV